jgi:4-hydroxy-tetrahydrodipicolinate reductase
MCRLLESGINMVTTRSEFFYAKTMDPTLSKPLEVACQKGQSSLFATGSSPGFSTAVLPLAMAYMSRRLDCITIDEFADIPASTTPDMITNVMGFGRPMPGDSSKQRAHATIGFSQSLGAVADGFGIGIDGFETFMELAAANSPVQLPGGAVLEAGTIAAQRITTAGMRSGKPVLQFRANWYCTRDIDQHWELGENGWRVSVEGDTPMNVNITFPRTEHYADQMSGLTAHPSVNAVPYVCDAASGIRSNLDLPIIVPKFG